MNYLRTTRAATPVYGADEQFEIGGARVLRSSATDEVALVAAGITLRVAAHDRHARRPRHADLGNAVRAARPGGHRPGRVAETARTLVA